uniref:little elongation complex subunit 1-like n=1 Tax=Euleptes europaea TaxID=460621 RepID=UPI0025405F21|nr:little elongation complex subunit 1-like [Euleptes europaea]
MLQKLSPLEKCKEELGSVQAELEEKKSSLKIYQDTHQEYVRVKEEMGKSDAMKKKLEAKVKKLEKATEKHNQDFRQLQAEKKVLEKELKKAQEKIESFPSEKQKKVVRHVETQSEREWPVTNLDRGRTVPFCKIYDHQHLIAEMLSSLHQNEGVENKLANIPARNLHLGCTPG